MGGDFCCAVGCHNNRGANQDVTFHVFPRDLQRRARWIAAVRRAHWVPTKASRLCSVHFTEESYELSSRLSKEFGLGQRAPRLNADAVPTIFNYVVAPSTPLRGAFAKRRRKDTVDEAIVEHAAMAAANSVPDPNPDPIPVGNGDLVPDGGQFSMDVSGPEVEPTPRNACVFIQTDPVQTCTQSNQTKIKVRSIGTQTAFPKPSKEVQTETTQQTNSATSNPVLVDAPTDDAHGSDSDDDPLGLLLQDPRDTDYHPNSSEDEEAPGTGANTRGKPGSRRQVHRVWVLSQEVPEAVPALLLHEHPSLLSTRRIHGEGQHHLQRWPHQQLGEPAEVSWEAGGQHPNV
ncbi:unnamed protein product [Ixodes hexagonus]